MSEFQERIKKFSKCRDYVRDFFVYGFKSREDFHYKSSRTYDDERRRIESWLTEYVRQDYQESSKNISLQMDSNLLDTNPLYRVWKTRSFTDADISLHFFLLDQLRSGAWLSVNALTDQILENYGVNMDPQMVRRKCREYEKEGLLLSRKEGKTVLYHIGLTLQELIDTVPSENKESRRARFSASGELLQATSSTPPECDPHGVLYRIGGNFLFDKNKEPVHTAAPGRPEASTDPSSATGQEKLRIRLLDAISFFQLSAPFGVIGSTLSDQQLTENRIFRIKHSFLVHTLEDEILLALTEAMKLPAAVRLTIISSNGRSGWSRYGLPLRIFVSTRTGRRYLCFYHWNHRSAKGQFHGIRLDQIKTVETCSRKNTPEPVYDFLKQKTACYDELLDALDRNQDFVWGISFQGNYRQVSSRSRTQTIHLTLHIDEKTEQHILHRLEREGKGGTIIHLAPDTYQYKKTVFDAQEAVPWLRTFICRIIELKVTEPETDDIVPPAANRLFSRRFDQDIEEMYRMYDIT